MPMFCHLPPQPSSYNTDSSLSQSGSTASSTADEVVNLGHNMGSTTSGANVIDRLVDTFYNCFYPSYPFLVPPWYYNQDPSSVPQYLQDVMRFIGSHFVPGWSPELLRPAAIAVLSQDVPETGSKVQSFFLLAISLFARFEIEVAVEAFNGAIDLALKLGMNRKEFSSIQGGGNSVLEESWRRTWWDLYVVDGLVSGVDSLGWRSRLRDVLADTPLPCEDAEYGQEAGNLAQKVSGTTTPQARRLPLKTLVDIENRAFDDYDHPWSSFAYEIEAMRIMHNVLQATTDTRPPSDAEIEALDASLSGFMFSLPTHKRDLAVRDGKVDEKLFVTHMLMHWAAILLHRPRSDLASLGERYATTCSQGEFVELPVLSYAAHTSKALRAADEISKMTALGVPLCLHTPCFTCAIAKAAVVHLPAYILETSPRAASIVKERLQLAINGLKTMGEVWPMAVMVKQQISQYAREALSAPRMVASLPAPVSCVQQIDPTAFGDDSWVDLLGTYDPSSAIRSN